MEEQLVTKLFVTTVRLELFLLILQAKDTGIGRQPTEKINIRKTILKPVTISG
jgi:hypothetical protein